MTPPITELLLEGAEEAGIQRFIALAGTLALWALWVRYDRWAQKAPLARPKARGALRAVPLVALLAWQLPWLRFELLQSFGRHEETTLTAWAQRSRRARFTKWRHPVIRLCAVDVRTRRDERWNTVLTGAACDVARPGMAVPFVVFPPVRAIRQQGFHAQISWEYQVYTALVACVLWGCVLLGSRLPRSTIPQQFHYYREEDDQPLPTLGRRRFRQATVAWESREKKPSGDFPRDQRWLEVLLSTGGRVGEYMYWAMFPIGSAGDQDPNRSGEFWVRITDYPRHARDEGDVVGPFPLPRR